MILFPIVSLEVAEPPPPLAAGSIALNGVPTTTTIPLIASDASGGTPPYSRQWYRSTSSGFTPGPGNIVAGATGLVLNDTGRTPATTYYYKVIYTDALTDTVTSAQFSAATASILVAGTISARGTSTSTCIPLIASDATGGVTPYTYQWYQSTVNGFTPGPANILVGKTALILNNGGLTPSTTYYYRIIYTDAIGQTATAVQYSASTAAGGVDVILANTGYTIGTYADLPAAITAAGSQESTVIVANAQEITNVTGDVTIPANITLMFEAAGQITVDLGRTLAINGPVQAGPKQIFAGSGLTVFNNQFLADIWAEWFGAIADGNPGAASGTDNTAAVNAAIYAIPPSSGTITLRFAGHAYRFNGSINIINNPTNRNRRNLRLLGKDEGRRGNDVNSGTIFCWAGDSSTPLINLQSRNCTIQNIQVTAVIGHTLTAAIKSDDTGGLSQVLTTNYFKDVYINADGGGTVTDGIRIGESGGDNQEHHRFEGCQFSGMANAGVFADNGTGQMKYLQFEDCAFLASRYGYLAQVASADFNRCNFSGITETCLRWSGGAYEPCTVSNCDNENSAQYVYGGGVDLNIIGTRLSCEGGTPSPTPGHEYIYGTNNLTLINTQIQNGTTDFKIRPVDGGAVTAINVQFPNVTFLPLDNSISWVASFFGCQNPGLSIYIPDGIRRGGNFLTPNGLTSTLTEWAGRQRISNQGTVSVLNAPASKAYDHWWDANTNYARISQGGAYPNQFATVQPYGDTAGATGTFSASAGSVPAGTYDYGYTAISTSGESSVIRFLAALTNASIGEWILTNIPLGPAGTLTRKIYRSPANAGTWKLVGTLSDNTTTTLTDTAASPSVNPVSGGAGLVPSVALGTLTPTAAITATSSDIDPASEGSLVFLVNGVLVRLPYYSLSVPLTAGSISANGAVGATTVPVICTAATGGTPPYTYQWYRSTSSGFVPGAGSIVSGATSLILNDTGLSSSTTYYYKVVATDSASATATTSQYSATTSSSGSLTAGVISYNGNPTASAIPLVATNSSGGTAPYTYQWYRSLTSGFTPGPGNAIGGATSLTLSDTGRSQDVDYYYKIRYTDNVSATVTSTEFYASIPSAPFSDIGVKYSGNPVLDHTNALNPWDVLKIYITVDDFGSSGNVAAYYGAVDATETIYNTAYASSSDGISFTKPNLGDMDFGGNTNNNLVGGPSGIYGGNADYSASRGSGKKYLLNVEQDHSAGGGVGVFIWGSDTRSGTFARVKAVHINPDNVTSSTYYEAKGLKTRANGQIMAFYEVGQLANGRSIGALLSDTSDPAGTWTDLGILPGLDWNDDPDVGIQWYWIGRPLAYAGKWIAGVGRFNYGNGHIYLDLFYSSDEGATWALGVQDWITFGAGAAFDSQIFWGLSFLLISSQWRGYYAGGDGDHSNPSYNSNIGYVVCQPQPLVVGSISAVSGPTTTQIFPTISNSTGGNGYYAYQWYLSTSTGFTPGPGTILAGQTSQTPTVNGLNPNTDYYLKCTVESGPSGPITKTSAEFHQKTASAGFTPADFGADLLVFFQEVTGQCYTDDPPTALCNVNDLIQVVTPQFGPTISAKQATSGNRPTFQSDGASLDASNDLLTFTAAQAFTGDFTFYCAGKIVANSNWVPLGQPSGNSMIGYLHNGVVPYDRLYVINDSSGDQHTNFTTTGSVLIRVVRSSGTVKVAWTGQTELTLGSLGGTLTFDTIGSSSSGRNGSTSNRYWLQCGIQRVLTSGEMTNMEAWIVNNGGPSL